MTSPSVLTQRVGSWETHSSGDVTPARLAFLPHKQGVNGTGECQRARACVFTWQSQSDTASASLICSNANRRVPSRVEAHLAAHRSLTIITAASRLVGSNRMSVISPNVVITYRKTHAWSCRRIREWNLFFFFAFNVKQKNISNTKQSDIMWLKRVLKNKVFVLLASNSSKHF